MGTPEQPRGTKPFRQWDEEENLSVAMDRDLDSHPPTVGRDSCGELAGLWPTATVDTLLIAWGYGPDPQEGWMEIDALLWYHIDSLFSLFTEYDRGGPAPFKHQARFAVDEYDRSRNWRNDWRTKERERLIDEQENEKIDNSRWLADYTLKWLGSGLRLLEVKESKQ